MRSYSALILSVLLLPAAGCASALAKAPVEPVALDVSPVPPRVIDPAPLPQPAAIAPVEEIPVAPATPAPAKPRPQPRERAEAKPEVKPEPVEPDPVTPPPALVPPLRTGTSANGPEADRQIKEILGRANRLLEGVDRNALSEDGKANYDAAKESINRADEALRVSNLVLARLVAERAENIAKRLGGK